MDSDEKFVYCSLRKCPHQECLRHNANTPFDVIITRKKYGPDKDWNCKDILYNFAENNVEKTENEDDVWGDVWT